MGGESTMTALWLLGDQLGPHFDDGTSPVVIIEAKSMFTRRRYHRQKAHLILVAMRRRARELGDRATYVRTHTFAAGVASVGHPLRAWHPHSRAAHALLASLDVEIASETPGFLTSWDEFDAWVRGRGSSRLLLEDWYRSVRTTHGILMEDGEPRGGRWNFDEENRQPPPRGRAHLRDDPPWRPVEDDVDSEVREDLDRWEREGIAFAGRDGPRQFAAARSEAILALTHFMDQRLVDFGPFEDAMMQADPFMAHSMLSGPVNLGLLAPHELVTTATEACAKGAPLASVEGFIRQVIGWREYVWHLYWHLGAEYENLNFLSAENDLPEWFETLNASEVTAACLADVLRGVSERGWVHHIPRLMILANWALQRGYRPSDVNDWFQRMFIDGYPWVMAANTIGMGVFADGGIVATKPYAAGGAYISKMSNYCSGCEYSPSVRVGAHACPFTAGYWWFLDREQDMLRGSHRMSRALAALRSRGDIAEIRVQEDARGAAAP